MINYVKIEAARGKFHKNVFPEPNTGCWLWAGRINKSGYGILKIGNSEYAARKISYFLERGEFLNCALIGHICDSKLCVNPNHIFVNRYRTGSEYMKVWRQKNKERLSQQKKELYRNKKGINSSEIIQKDIPIVTVNDSEILRINKKIRRVLIGRVRHEFKKIIPKVQSSYIAPFICSDINSVRIWIENQFHPMMTWDSYLKSIGIPRSRQWQIDHRTPLSMATNLEELIALSHYTNLQPLWADDNAKKGGVKKRL